MLNFSPKGIEKVDDDSLRITWEDAHVSVYTFQYLRQNCPCALCRDEFSGEMLLDPATVSKETKSARVELVGRRADVFGRGESSILGSSFSAAAAAFGASGPVPDR